MMYPPLSKVASGAPAWPHAGHARRPASSSRRRSDDPAPAPLAGLPAGDGPVLADHLDLPQMQPGAAHSLLRPGHPSDARQLRDLVLGTGLLDEDETGRAGSTGRIVALAHHPETPGSSRGHLNGARRTDVRPDPVPASMSWA